MLEGVYEIRIGTGNNYKTIPASSKTQAKLIFNKACRRAQNKSFNFVSWTVQMLHNGQPIKTMKFESVSK